MNTEPLPPQLAHQEPTRGKRQKHRQLEVEKEEKAIYHNVLGPEVLKKKRKKKKKHGHRPRPKKDSQGRDITGL